MVIWRLKNCPRCGGDSFIDEEADEKGRKIWMETCLLCSWKRELAEVKAVEVESG